MYSTQGEAADPVPRHAVTVGWVVRRAVFGVVLLAALMGSFAWLTYSSLTTDENDAAASAKVRTAESR